MATDEQLVALAKRSRILKGWALFLESQPAFVEQLFEEILHDTTPQSSSTHLGLAFPRIQLHCEQCDGVRGFDSGTNFTSASSNATVVVVYTCRDCGWWKKTFALMFQFDRENRSVKAMKVGEFPPFGSHLAKRLQKMLNEEDLQLYRKGLRSEREGQGIGAAAYFRRVVENQWKDLVGKLRDAAKALGTPAERLALFEDALKQTQFSTAVELLKDAIPPKLLILDGKNPLTLLYKPLSVQLHGLTDEQCLRQAADIRLVLNELFDNIGRVLRDEEELRGAVTRLQGI